MPAAGGETTEGEAGGATTLLSLLGRDAPRRVLVWPVPDQDRLARIVALLTAADGIDGVTIEDHDGHDLQITVQVTGPIAVGDALRARMERGIVACRERGGRIELELLPRSSGRPAPGDPPPRPAVPPRPVPAAPAGPAARRPAGGAPVSTGRDAGDLTMPPGLRDLLAGGAPAGRRSSRTPTGREVPPRAPIPAPTDACRTTPGAPRRRWAPTPVPVASDALIDGAARSVAGVSLLVCDVRLRVRAITGPAYGRRPDLGDPSPGRDVRDVLPPQTWAALAPGLAAALGGATEGVEFAGPPTGAWYLATCAPIVDGGAVIGATVVARDRALARSTDVEVAAVRDELAVVFDRSPVPQALVSADGRWVRLNEAFAELLGTTSAEVVGHEIATHLHPEDRPGAVAGLADLMAGRSSEATTRARLLPAGGDPRIATLHLSVLRSGDGVARGVVLQVLERT